MYKYPRLKDHGSLYNSGVAYSYMTSDHIGAWKLSNLSINSTSSIIGRTLNNLYPNNVGFFKTSCIRNLSVKCMYIYISEQVLLHSL